MATSASLAWRTGRAHWSKWLGAEQVVLELLATTALSEPLLVDRAGAC